MDGRRSGATRDSLACVSGQAVPNPRHSRRAPPRLVDASSIPAQGYAAKPLAHCQFKRKLTDWQEAEPAGHLGYDFRYEREILTLGFFKYKV